MSQENVERFLEVNEAFNRGDIEAVLARPAVTRIRHCDRRERDGSE
jgi:hypothetical protein